MSSKTELLRFSLCSLVLVCAGLNMSFAAPIQKIENPYVELLEQELEYEFVYQRSDEDSLNALQNHRFEYARSISDRLLIEFGVSGVNDASTDLEIESYEIEAKFQLSEQGEFNNDWGLLLELERDDDDEWEIGSTLIVSHTWSSWQGTANIGLDYEFGDDKSSELEASFSGQLKYRYRQGFEPAVELFADENGPSVGPSILGQVRLSGRRKFYWEAGLSFGLDDDIADTIFRLSTEYEF